jgi:hypothetical protein
MFWYFFGGGAAAIDAGALTPASVEELSDRIEIVVEDPARAEAAQKTLDELKTEVAAFGKKFTASGRAISRSYRNHAAGPTEIEAVLEHLNQDWERSQERALDLRFELRDQLTREEWAALYSKE